jgi:hypothetical protein
MGDPIATFGFELPEGSHLQVHVNWAMKQWAAKSEI